MVLRPPWANSWVALRLLSLRTENVVAGGLATRAEGGPEPLASARGFRRMLIGSHGVKGPLRGQSYVQGRRITL